MKLELDNYGGVQIGINNVAVMSIIFINDNKIALKRHAITTTHYDENIMHDSYSELTFNGFTFKLLNGDLIINNHAIYNMIDLYAYYYRGQEDMIECYNNGLVVVY